MTVPVPRALTLLRGRFAVCRLDPEAGLPAWAFGRDARLWSVTRLGDELSVVVEESGVPPSVATAEPGWRALALAGPIPLDATGVVAALTAPLAAAQVAVFVISTYDTDLLLIQEADLDRARAALAGGGFSISEAAGSTS